MGEEFPFPAPSLPPPAPPPSLSFTDDEESFGDDGAKGEERFPAEEVERSSPDFLLLAAAAASEVALSEPRSGLASAEFVNISHGQP